MQNSRTRLGNQPEPPTLPSEFLVTVGDALVASGTEMRRAGLLLKGSESWGGIAPQEEEGAFTNHLGCSLPAEGYVRIWDIIGRKAARGRPAVCAVIPVSRATWYAGIKAGRFPTPVKTGGVALWRVEDIRALVRQLMV